ncbi:MAG: CDGSH iron-sulfur domain-containing protein [Armatimonadetes bacterium]|nr:CDGSH iron-sulfur domain-containing protein [Armatimonadota bacterium]
MPDVKIQILENAPVLVTGPVSLVDHQGNPIPVPRDGVIALCRCGASRRKPFCDGAHKNNGFDGTLCFPTTD